MPAFDWYQATVPAEVNDVLEALCGGLGDVGLKHTKGIQGYATATLIEDVDGVIGKVLHGGTHMYPNVLFTSEAAQHGAQVTRAAFPAHSVTRVDVCHDFFEEGAFDRILPGLLDVAQRHRVRVDTRGDHLLTKQGRTVYLGAPTSAVRLRQYDKAAEQRAKFARDPVRLLSVPEHMTRFEVQVRPQTKTAREHLATVQPEAVYGSSRWVAELWQGLSGVEPEPLQVGKLWRQSDHDRAYRNMLSMSFRVLLEMRETHGSACAVGKQIFEDLDEMMALKRRQKGGRSH